MKWHGTANTNLQQEVPRMERVYIFRVAGSLAERVELLHGSRAHLAVRADQEDIDDKVAHGWHVVERRCGGETKKR